MDRWRRDNVRAAVGALPAAIVAMAGVFRDGKLGNSALPLVQSVLGGFVDVNAADNYKKFMTNPAPELIPTVGDQFPREYLAPGINETPPLPRGEASEGISIEFNDGVPKSSSTSDGSTSHLEPRAPPGGLLERFLDTFVGEAHAQQEEGGQEDGSKAAEILMGIAMIIQAIQPMVSAAIQAGADKSIARTNANAQIRMTQITANTSRFLSNQQREIALTQTFAAQEIAEYNNAAVSQRLQMQLAELKSARNDQAERERERIRIEQELNEERIQLARTQADQNITLAQRTLNAQLTQAGLSTGFSNSRNSGDRLTTQRQGSSRSPSSPTSSRESASTDEGRSSRRTAERLQTAEGRGSLAPPGFQKVIGYIPERNAPILPVRTTPAGSGRVRVVDSENRSVSPRAVRGGRSRLLGGLRPTPPDSEKAEENSATPRKVSFRGFAASRATKQPGSALAAVLAGHQLQRGSTERVRLRIPRPVSQPRPRRQEIPSGRILTLSKAPRSTHAK